MASKTTSLFIYGTLKRGEVNHHLLEKESFLGPAQTSDDYRLLKLGWYPGLVAVECDGRSIDGELWQVSAACLARLDEYEGSEYLRTRVTLKDASLDQVETYLLATPDWSCPDAGSSW